MSNKKTKRRSSRYSRMKQVAKRVDSRNEPLPRIGFKEASNEFWREAKQMLRSKIFRRTVLISTSFLLMATGLGEVQRSRSAQAYEQAMTVSPSNEPMAFALSGVNIVFNPQFRSGQTYIVPFEISDLESLSLNPSDYIIQLQGTNEPIDPSMSARMVLFGTSGRGAIVIDGEYTGEPVNIYIISTNSLVGTAGQRVVVTSDQIRDMQAQQGNLIINQNADGTSDEERNDDVRTGVIRVGGQEMVVAVDMVATRLNPSANNVTPTYREVDANATAAELYDVTFGAVDRSVTLTNIESAQAQREEIIDTIHEYNSRLEDDPNLLMTDIDLIIEANDIAINSLGEAQDNERIEALLAQTSAYSAEEVSRVTRDNRPLSEMTDDERRAFLQEDIDMDGLGISQQTSTLEALNRLRRSVADLNYQIAVYEVELDYISDVSAQQDTMGRSSVRYEILTPFR